MVDRIGEFGIGEFGIGEFGIGEFGIGEFGGVALECRDPAALAAFYRRLTGWTVVYESEDWWSLGADAEATLHLSFQRAPGHRSPRWPDPGSSMQAHLHVRVADLDHAERAAVAAGAVRAVEQPDPDGARVLLDPAGHPFCLVRGR